MLEGVYASNTQLEKFRYKMIDYKTKYTDDYFNDISIGEGVYVVMFNRKGNSVSPGKRAAARTSKSRVGDGGGDTSEEFIKFNIRAGRGIEHPDTYKSTDIRAKSGAASEGLGSPYSDAVIKAIIVHGKEILDHMEEVTYTSDDSGAEIAAAKNSPELAAKVQGKMDLLDKQTNKPKRQSSDDGIKTLEMEKEELTNKLASLKGNDKSVRVEAKKVRDELKLLNKELKKLYYDGSSKDDYLRNK
tara:strand:- start:2597 stop:3328 length:732 start_codon:yes stop_codon:yes gene_type:complete